jgi:hypothetical protein
MSESNKTPSKQKEHSNYVNIEREPHKSTGPPSRYPNLSSKPTWWEGSAKGMKGSTGAKGN